MNILSSILDRENITHTTVLNIISTPCQNEYFTKFIQSMGHNLISAENLYYGAIVPNLIISNNKIIDYHDMKLLSIRYHCPIIIIDHNVKNNFIDEQLLIQINNIQASYKIAISSEIAKSWGSHYNQIISYDNTDQSKEIWNNLLHNLAMRIYII